MVVIKLDEIDSKFPVEKIGVDMGQSLSKIAYLESNKLYLLYFPTRTYLESFREIIEPIIKDFSQISYTGGKSFKQFKYYSNSIQTNLINEFEANIKGVEAFYLLEKKRDLSNSLIVSIGTGTSMVSKKDTFEHLGGSALGGGFFMGLLKIVFNMDDFQEALIIAKKGTRYNVDLKVSDVYAPEDKRINILFREFTAASLGKIDHGFSLADLNKGDFINSLICMIGENIGMLANLMADKNEISNIVFCGGFLKENRIAKKILSLICNANKKKAIFLKHPEFCAAMGALLL